MQPVLVTFLCLIAYIAGLVILWRVTPRLLTRSFEDSWFMGYAVLDILGAILAFAGVIVSLALYDGAIPIKVIDFLLLLGIFWTSLRLASFSFRPRARTIRSSRLITGGFCIFLVGASLYLVVQLFIA